MPTLKELFPDQSDLLALEPEELAGVLTELIPSVSQSAGFNIGSLTAPLFPPQGGGYSPGIHNEVVFALAEAVSWLCNQGILMDNPTQPAGHWFLLTRRGRTIRSRTDLEAFRKGRDLPRGLLQESLAQKVVHLFLRGDLDTAVFQAFKEVEVAVRRAGNYANDVVGRDLMQKAFHPETGPLTDMTAVLAERQSEMFLFSGAMGHAKNPVSHRDVELGRQEAARLIIFASHLLDIVEERAATNQA